jgi:NitT/TauT family transport system ATP-binding protein
MQQRVAIARRSRTEPEVLLIDEPFGALDALTRASAQRFLTEVWERHRRTIAFVTHDIEKPSTSATPST